MIHAREDYQRFQDPAGKIKEDEPVLLFRAQDIHFVPVLNFYKELLEKSGNNKMADCIGKHIELATEWQNNNGNKIKHPDL